LPSWIISARLRRASAITAVAAVLLAATGCAAIPVESGPASGSGDFPVTIEHAFGETVVPAEPKRVVTVGVTEQDTVLALGVIPVGVTDWYGDQPYATWPWAQDELGDGKPVVLTTTDGLQFEKIAELEPDLIIGTNAGLTEDDYTTLSAIAPTLAHDADYPVYFEPWDIQAIAIGTALGKKAEIEDIIADIRAQFADAAAANPEFEGVPTIFLQNAFYDGSAIAYQEGLSTAFLTDLGLTVPKDLDPFVSPDCCGQAYIPMEELSVLNSGKVLLWATEAPEDRTALEAEPLYRELEAVKNGSLVFTDSETAGAIYFSSVLSLPYVLEQLVPALKSTLAGDGPATTGE